jgi:DDE superfamily endonuclease
MKMQNARRSGFLNPNIYSLMVDTPFFTMNCWHPIVVFVITFKSGVGATNCEFFLVFYAHNWRNHRPRTREELFNRRHASLRNVIERIFGILKRRFRILRSASEYDLKTQVRLPRALAAIHNFIRQYDLDSGDDRDWNYDGDDSSAGPVATPLGDQDNEVDERAKIWRDEIAERMWLDYQQYLQERGDTSSTDDEDGDLSSEESDGSDGEDTEAMEVAVE